MPFLVDFDSFLAVAWILFRRKMGEPSLEYARGCRQFMHCFRYRVSVLKSWLKFFPHCAVIRPYPGSTSSMVSSPSFPSASSTPSIGRLRRTTTSLLPPPPPLPRYAPSSPPTRPPPPIPPHSSTLVDVSNLLAGMDVSSSDGDDWKSSLFKAANSLAERLASGLEGMGDRIERVDERKLEGGSGVSGGVGLLLSRMKKSPSFSGKFLTCPHINPLMHTFFCCSLVVLCDYWIC